MVVSNEDTSLYFEESDHQSEEDDDITLMNFGGKLLEDLDYEKYGCHF